MQLQDGVYTVNPNAAFFQEERTRYQICDQMEAFLKALRFQDFKVLKRLLDTAYVVLIIR